MGSPRSVVRELPTGGPPGLVQAHHTAYKGVSRTEDRAEFRKALDRLRRVIKSTEKALGPEVIDRAPKDD